MENFSDLKYEISSLTVYRCLREKPVIKRPFLGYLPSAEIMPLVVTVEIRLEELISCYTNICTELYESGFSGSLYDYLYDAVLYDGNIFTTESANSRYPALPEQVKSSLSSGSFLSVPADIRFGSICQKIDCRIVSELSRFDLQLTGISK